jgi:hypothetical protein
MWQSHQASQPLNTPNDGGDYQNFYQRIPLLSFPVQMLNTVLDLYFMNFTRTPISFI